MNCQSSAASVLFLLHTVSTQVFMYTCPMRMSTSGHKKEEVERHFGSDAAGALFFNGRIMGMGEEKRKD